MVSVRRPSGQAGLDVALNVAFSSFTSTAASCSSASVPSAALVLLLMVLSAINTPTQDVSLLFAIDWIVYVFAYFRVDCKC